jgi:hypothetical protein
VSVSFRRATARIATIGVVSRASYPEHVRLTIGIALVMQIGIAFPKSRTRAFRSNQCRFTAMRDLRG